MNGILMKKLVVFLKSQDLDMDDKDHVADLWHEYSEAEHLAGEVMMTDDTLAGFGCWLRNRYEVNGRCK